MKKITLILGLALIAISCSKKEYTCECVNTTAQGTYISTTSSTKEWKNVEEAEQNCANNSHVDAAQISHVCSLK